MAGTYKHLEKQRQQAGKFMAGHSYRDGVIEEEIHKWAWMNNGL